MDDLELAQHIARAAGDRLVALRADFGTVEQSDARRRRELMDAGDAAAEALIAALLHQHRPADAVLSEEAPDSRHRLGADRVWIIDPLDGTSEFGQARPDFAVHVALWRRDDGPAGGHFPAAVVDVPALGELWTTQPAAPAPLPSDRPLKMVVSRSRRPAGMDELLAQVSEGAAAAGINAHGMVEANVGSVGAKMGEVMAGRAEAYLHPGGLNEWDLAAPYACALAHGYVAVRGAGERFNRMPPKSGPILVVHPELVELFPG